MSANHRVKTRFPLAKIKKIMQSDKEVGKLAQATPVVVSRALELFLATLIDDCISLIFEGQSSGGASGASSPSLPAVAGDGAEDKEDKDKEEEEEEEELFTLPSLMDSNSLAGGNANASANSKKLQISPSLLKRTIYKMEHYDFLKDIVKHVTEDSDAFKSEEIDHSNTTTTTAPEEENAVKEPKEKVRKTDE